MVDYHGNLIVLLGKRIFHKNNQIDFFRSLDVLEIQFFKLVNWVEKLHVIIFRKEN